MQTSDHKSCYISLGSNLGDKKQNLEKAVQLIAERVGTVSAVSSVYETKPWGYESVHMFFNMVIRIKTDLSPTRLLKVTQNIEKEMGRTKKSSGNFYQDRIIDIDLIIYDDLTLETPELTLPHPHYREREFVMKPLCEIAPEFK
ncbi:MAG: 2-amino-4-hydroxy-6-hydroxymethyldihydropteridine diphosphokinase [Dysgonamonadaceae bacterium]|nr:2-amino-4-hydroxy-6-hydroxymethyldihydropteridine diphosphokinase [Dysgonamonadaceae bacterium]